MASRLEVRAHLLTGAFLDWGQQLSGKVAVVEGLEEEQFGVCWLIAGKRSAGAV